MNQPIQSPRLTFADRWLAVRAGLLISYVSLYLKKRDFKRSKRLLDRLSSIFPRSKMKSGNLADAAHIADLIDLGNRRYALFTADCLPRSLVLDYYLKREGFDSQLCMGARTITGRFEAHAWVEVERVPLNEDEAVQDIYTKFDWDRERNGSRP